MFSQKNIEAKVQPGLSHLGQDYSSFGVSMDIISVRNNLKQPKTEKTETETLAL